MGKVKVAVLGMEFDSKKNLIEQSFNFPKGTEILSVQSKNSKNVLWISYMFPSSEFSSSETWQKFSFVIVKCNYTEVEIDKHKYIGTITVDDDSYAVFYKKNSIH